MRNETRIAFDAWLNRLASLNHVQLAAVVSKFTADPSVQQTMENKIQESSEFLKSINLFGVREQEGEKIGLGIGGPIASTTDTKTKERQPKSVAELDNNKYRCEQTNYDTYVTYAQLDQWAKFPDFQVRLTNMILQAIALSRITIGFNGNSRAATSDPAANPLLQDVGIGWLQKLRTKAPQRRLFETDAGSGELKVGGSAEYKNLDAVVFDLVNNMVDPWYQEDTKLVAICGRKLLADKYFPLVNSSQAPTEQLAADLIISQKRIGNLPAVRVPYFPPNAILVTRLDNLSLYYQEGAQRRSVIDNPARDRIDTFQSSNDAYELEDYGCAALAENITLV